MLHINGVGGLLLLALWIYCLCDVIATDNSLTRHLPKFTWLIIVIILPAVGCVLWLVLGRPERAGWRPGDTTVRRPFSTRFVVRGPEDDPSFRPAPRPGPSPEIAGRREELQAREDDVRRKELAAWEADLKRREENLRRNDGGDGLYGGNRW